MSEGHLVFQVRVWTKSEVLLAALLLLAIVKWLVSCLRSCFRSCLTRKPRSPELPVAVETGRGRRNQAPALRSDPIYVMDPEPVPNLNV